MNLRRLQKNFEALAAEDPLWTVLSDKDKRGGKWDPDVFYQSGEDAVRHLEEQLARLGLRMRGKEALDFGCGVGRLTFPLSRRFERAVGIDISASMIRQAEQNAGRGNDCCFILNTESNLACLENDRFDFIYSDIVLQHMAPRYARRYLKEFARVLSPGGALAFQLPSHLNPSAIENQTFLRLPRKRLHYRLKGLAQALGFGEAYFEMNAIPAPRLIRFLHRRSTLQLLSLWNYPAAGPSWTSYLYLFQKTRR